MLIWALKLDGNGNIVSSVSVILFLSLQIPFNFLYSSYFFSPCVPASFPRRSPDCSLPLRRAPASSSCAQYHFFSSMRPASPKTHAAREKGSLHSYLATMCKSVIPWEIAMSVSTCNSQTSWPWIIFLFLRENGKGHVLRFHLWWSQVVSRLHCAKQNK